jgi:hypothetical protein
MVSEEWWQQVVNSMGFCWCREALMHLASAYAWANTPSWLCSCVIRSLVFMVYVC